MTSVLIFVPTYKSQVTSTTLLTTHMLTKALWAKGIGSGITTISVPDVEWVRGYALTLFYDKLTEYSHLLFIDDDMGFDPQVVIDMLTFGEPVVGAIYRKRTTNVEWAVSGVEKPDAARGPFMEVEGLGMGCFMIRRDAVTTMLEQMPEVVDTRKNSVNGFMQDAGLTRLINAFACLQVETGKVSEDFSFCRRWRQCGGKVWAATHYNMRHVGPHSYEAVYSDWVRGEIERRAKLAETAPAELAELLDKAQVKTSPLRTVDAKHGKFQYNPNDTFIGRSLAAYGEWCEFEIKTMAQFLKPDSVVIDVGANIGAHTIALGRLVPQGKVFAFEPQARLAAMLETNVFMNKMDNVFLSVAAVGNICGRTLVPDLPADDVEFNFGGLALHTPATTASEVDVATIDIMKFERVDLIKIDVEGMEAAVIRGAVETIKRCEPVLYIENHGEESSKIAEALQLIGYKAFWSIEPYFNPDNFLRNRSNIWLERWPGLVPSANLLALPKSVLTNLDLQPFEGAHDNWRKALERAQRLDAAE